MVTANIDGDDITVPKGTLIIRAAELLGTEIPRFCDHPLLDPVAACRQCLVEIDGMPKPQPACAIALTDDMKVKTQVTSEEADVAQKGVMEFLLANHPLDCPICDKGGECPLQNQAMSNGRGESRFTLPKREFPKPINISAEILLDRERCVNCQRCTRFADEIAGDPLIDLLERGAEQQIGIGEEPFDSYFSGNTIQICPVGALTSAEYRFRARPFDLVSVPTTCEHCASGCATRTDIRHGKTMRRQAWDEPEVNEEWNCDKGRFAFPYLTMNRLSQPLVREDGQLRQASWPEALRIAADGLLAAQGRAAVLAGGRLTLEDAYAYSRFARVALGSDNVDFRARAASDEEANFLVSQVAGTAGPTYRDLANAPYVLLVSFEPEEESPIVYLRLRKAARKNSLQVASVAPFASAGLAKLSGEVLPTVPGAEAEALKSLPASHLEQLKADGAIIMVGERAAGSAGALAAAAELAAQTGARLAWVPRRAGERGALDAGLLAGSLPGGRPASDADAREQVAHLWGIAADNLPTTGRTLTELAEAVAADAAARRAAQENGEDEPENQIDALIVAGLEPDDLPDPSGFHKMLADVPFLIATEIQPTVVTAAADVVFPVAAVVEKGGTFVDWEGRRRPFAPALPEAQTFADAEVLALLADHMNLDPAPRDVGSLRAEIDSLGAWQGARGEIVGSVGEGAAKESDASTAVLASWRMLLDLGVTQEGEPHLAATRKPPVARLSAATAAGIGVADGDLVRVSTEVGEIVLPLVMTEMPDGIVWVPFNSPDSRVTASLGVAPGANVRLSRGDQEGSGHA